jgi:hypothetical protein
MRMSLTYRCGANGVKIKRFFLPGGGILRHGQRFWTSTSCDASPVRYPVERGPNLNPAQGFRNAPFGRNVSRE